MKRVSLGVFIGLICGLSTVSAQQRSVADSVPSDSVRRISPGSAFYRSLLIPGWGQASVGAYVRGGTFFALQSTSAYMMLKTMSKLSDAKELERRRLGQASDSLRAVIPITPADSARLNDPIKFQAALDSVPSVVRARRLIDSRKEQRQDWVTYTLVFTLASGIDAFVAAHLANFPATVDATPRVGGGANLQVRVPVGRVQR